MKLMANAVEKIEHLARENERQKIEIERLKAEIEELKQENIKLSKYLMD